MHRRTARTTTDPSAAPSPRARRIRRISAAAVALALATTAASVSAASADNATPTLDSPAGYVSTLPGEQFSASGSTVSGPLPGNLPGRVSLSTAGFTNGATAAQTGEGPLSGGNVPYFPMNIVGADEVAVTSSAVPSAIKKCTTNLARNTLTYCSTTSATLTFPQPVIDPVIAVWSSSMTPSRAIGTAAIDSYGCLMSWSTAGISKIDGAAPGDRVSLTDVVWNTPGTWNFSYSNDRVVPQGSYPQPPSGSCFPSGSISDSGGPGFLLQVKGLVTTLQVDFPIYQVVTKTLKSTFWTTSYNTWRAYPADWVGFALPSTDLSIAKLSNPSSVTAGGNVAWNLTVKNNGYLPSHGFVIRDAIPAAVTNPQLVDPPAGCALNGRDLLCGIAPAGFAVVPNSSTVTAADILASPAGSSTSSVGTVLAPGASMTVSFSGTAATAGSIVNTATVGGVDLDQNTANNSSSATTTVTDASAWTVSKTATVNGQAPAGGVVKPGDVITYTVTATSTKGAVSNVVLSDDLSAVLNNATFKAGSGRLVVGGTTRTTDDPSGTPATLTSPSFTLADGQTATLTYQVTVAADAWLSTLTNKVTASGSTAPTSCDPCSTTNKTGALVLVQKTGVDAAGATVRVDGAAFDVLADSGGAPGAPIAATPAVHVSGQTGAFRLEGLMPGTYWLHETAAPTGYALLPQPVAFTVDATGKVAVVDTHANPNVTADGQTLTVADTPAMVLPHTGGHGTSLTASLGGAAALVALALALGSRRSRWRRQH